MQALMPSPATFPIRQGFRIENGGKAAPVEQIVLSGNI